MPAWPVLPLIALVDLKGSKASRSFDACLPPVRKVEPGVKVDKRLWAAFEYVTERQGFIESLLLVLSDNNVKKIANCTGHLFFPCDPTNITRCYVSVAVRNAAGKVVNTLSSKRPAETRRLAFMLFKKEVGQHLGRLLSGVEGLASPNGLRNTRSACALGPTVAKPQDADAVHPAPKPVDEASAIPESSAEAQNTTQSQPGAFNGLQYSFLDGSPQPVQLPHIPRRSPFQTPPPARYKRTQPLLARKEPGTQPETSTQPAKAAEGTAQRNAKKGCSVHTKCRNAFSKKARKCIADPHEREGLLASFSQQAICRGEHEYNMTKPQPLKGTIKEAIGIMHDALMIKLGDVAVHTRSISTVGTVGQIGKCITSKFQRPEQPPG